MRRLLLFVGALVCLLPASAFSQVNLPRTGGGIVADAKAISMDETGLSIDCSPGSDPSTVDGCIRALDAGGGGGGGGAPTDAQYVVMTSNATLTAERVLQGAGALDVVDNSTTVDLEIDINAQATHAASGTSVLLIEPSGSNTDGKISVAELTVDIEGLINIGSSQLTDGDVQEVDLDITNTPGAPEDNYCLTWNNAGGNMTWQSCGAAGGNNFDTIGTAIADTGGDTITITDTLAIDLITTDDPEDLSANFEYANTGIDLALNADECVFVATTTGGGFRCEGSTPDANEQQYLFEDVNDADTTFRIVTTTQTQTLSGKTLAAASNNLDLEGVTLTNISDDELLIGDAAGSGTYVALPATDCNTTTEKLHYNSSTRTFSCQTDAGAGGGMTSFTVEGDDGATGSVVTDGEVLTINSGLGIVTDDNDNAADAQLTVSFDYGQILGGDPTLGVRECVFSSEGASGGGFLCEGSTGGNTNEQLYKFPAVDGADTQDFIVVDGSQVTSVDGDGLTIAGDELHARVDNSTTLPGTCTVGQTYLDTDANHDGEMFVCVATNTWKSIDISSNPTKVTEIDITGTDRCDDLQAALNGYLLDSTRGTTDQVVRIHGTMTVTYTGTRQVSTNGSSQNGPYRTCLSVVPTDTLFEGFPVYDADFVQSGDPTLTLDWRNAQITLAVDTNGPQADEIIVIDYGGAYPKGRDFDGGHYRWDNGKLRQTGDLYLKLADSESGSASSNGHTSMATGSLFDTTNNNTTVALGMLYHGAVRVQQDDFKARIECNSTDNNDIGVINISSLGLSMSGWSFDGCDTNLRVYGFAPGTLSNSYFEDASGRNIEIGDAANGASMLFWSSCYCGSATCDGGTGSCSTNARDAANEFHVTNNVIEGAGLSSIIAFGGWAQSEMTGNHIEHTMGSDRAHGICLGCGVCAGGANEDFTCGSDSECPSSTCSVPANFEINTLTFNGGTLPSDFTASDTSYATTSGLYLGKGFVSNAGQDDVLVIRDVNVADLLCNTTDCTDLSENYATWFGYDAAADITVDLREAELFFNNQVPNGYPKLKLPWPKGTLTEEVVEQARHLRHSVGNPPTEEGNAWFEIYVSADAAGDYAEGTRCSSATCTATSCDAPGESASDPIETLEDVLCKLENDTLPNGMCNIKIIFDAFDDWDLDGAVNETFDTSYGNAYTHFDVPNPACNHEDSIALWITTSRPGQRAKFDFDAGANNANTSSDPACWQWEQTNSFQGGFLVEGIETTECPAGGSNGDLYSIPSGAQDTWAVYVNTGGTFGASLTDGDDMFSAHYGNSTYGYQMQPMVLVNPFSNESRAQDGMVTALNSFTVVGGDVILEHDGFKCTPTHVNGDERCVMNIYGVSSTQPTTPDTDDRFIDVRPDEGDYIVVYGAMLNHTRTTTGSTGAINVDPAASHGRAEMHLHDITINANSNNLVMQDENGNFVEWDVSCADLSAGGRAVGFTETVAGGIATDESPHILNIRNSKFTEKSNWFRWGATNRNSYQDFITSANAKQQISAFSDPMSIEAASDDPGCAEAFKAPLDPPVPGWVFGGPDIHRVHINRNGDDKTIGWTP